jgi:RimJ/RimL family protein N-acetyltransferase
MKAEARFERFGGGQARLVRLDESAVREADIRRIAEICDQPEVKRWVTSDAATGTDGTYTQDDARAYVEIAADGWKTGALSAYLVRDAEDVIQGVVSLKPTDDPNQPEVGYWSDTAEDSPGGYMTNAVDALCELAAQAGYKSVLGQVAIGNPASGELLLRAGFKASGTGMAEQNGRTLEVNRYVRPLSP